MKAGDLSKPLIKKMLTEGKETKKGEEGQELPPCKPELHKTKSAHNYPMDKESIFEKLTTKDGKADIIKDVRKG